MALRLAINGLGRTSSQLIRVINEGGFSDLFEIAEIHDAAGPESIVRALRHDSVYGPFPGTLELDGESLKIGEQTIALSSEVDARNASWNKSDIPLVIVDGSARSDAAAFEQHINKGAKRVILPAASPLANFNLGIGVNEGSYDPEAHTIVASAAGPESGIAMMTQLLDEAAKLRCGSATLIAPATEKRGLLDTAAARGGAGALWSVASNTAPIFDQLVGRLSNRLSVTEVESSAQGAGSVVLSFWLEQKVALDELQETLKKAEESEQLVGLFGVVDGISSSLDVLRDSRTMLIDWSSANLLFDTFFTVSGWFDGEWAAACRLADTLALICEEGVPGTA